MKSSYGTAQHPSAIDYLVESNSRVTKSVAGSTCVNCANTQWVKSYTDMAGRAYKKLYPDNAQELSYYNAKGQLWKSVDADGIITLMEYDGRGRLVKRALDMDRDSQIDLAGNPIEDDRIFSTEYSVVDEYGYIKIRQTTSEWQTENQNVATVVSVSDKSANSLDSWSTQFGLVTHNTTTLNGGGNRTMVTVKPDGSSQVQVKSGDRVLEEKVMDSNSVQISKKTYTYDPHGRLSTETDARNGTTDYTYYNNDQVETVVLPAADATTPRQEQRFTYDAMGRLTLIELPDNSTKFNNYYLTGELKQSGGSQTYSQSYTYDSLGRRKTLTTDGDRVTTWNYDSQRGWLTSKVYDDNHGPSYTYTPGGKLAVRYLASGDTIYQYDNSGELSYIDYLTYLTPDVDITYNRRGFKIFISDGCGLRQMTYSPSGQLLTETGVFSTLVGKISHSYDSLLRRDSTLVQSTDGPLTGGPVTYRHLTYDYDGASRLNEITDVMHGQNFDYTYETNSGSIASLDRTATGSGLSTQWERDNLNRVVNVGTARIPDSQIIDELQYTYNSLNQRSKIQAADDTYWAYEYDNLGQVISGDKKLQDTTLINGYDFDYDFDGIGNRETASRSNYTQNYTSNDLNQYTQRTVPGNIDIVGEADPSATVQVNSANASRQDKFFYHALSAGNSSQPIYPLVTVTASNSVETSTVVGNVYVPQTPEQYAYDLDGNMLSDGRWNYTWDEENRLIAMESIATVPAAAKKRLEFIYDYMGRRVAKTVKDWTGSAWTAGVAHKYYYDGWNLAAEFEDGDLAGQYVWGIDLSGSLQGAGGVGGLLSVTNNTGMSYAIADANGNIMKLVDAGSLQTVADYEYGPFGELIRMTGPAARENPFRFSSKYQDEASGLLYYGYRYYDATIGRWISRDPIGDFAGIADYVCASNNYISGFDFIGLLQMSAGLSLKDFQFDPDDHRWNTGPWYLRFILRDFRYWAQDFVDHLRWLGLPNSSKSLTHYLGNSGNQYDFNGISMLKEDAGSRGVVVSEWTNAMFWVNHEIKEGPFVANSNPWFYDAGGHPQAPYGGFQSTDYDWFWAVGAFYMHGKGRVTCSDGVKSATVAFELGDRYNFHMLGWPDSNFALLHYVGLAKAYNRSGGWNYFKVNDLSNISSEEIDAQLQ